MHIVGLSGSLAQPSRTETLVDTLLHLAGLIPGSTTDLVSIAALGAELGSAIDPGKLPASVQAAQQRLAQADLLVVGTPIYKASYTGLLKHFFDLLDPDSLRGKVAILAATGGSEHHALALEHQLRPLLSFFGVHTVPSSLYVRDTAFAKDAAGHYRLNDPALQQRARLVVQQATALLGRELPPEFLPSQLAA